MDLRRMDAEQLRARFASGRRPERAVLARVLRAVVRQALAEREAAGDRAFIGSFRMFWHWLAEPVLARLSEPERGVDGYADLSRTLGGMVERGELRYRDLGLTDTNWEERRIGERFPECVVIIEKRGLFRHLLRLYRERPVTVCATGGFPSGTSSEYTADHVRERLAALGRPEAAARVVAIADYGPFGHSLADAFCRQLEQSGLRVKSLHRVLHPGCWGARELEVAALPLQGRSKGVRAQIDAWVSVTGGVGGRALRLEIESLPVDRLERLILQAVDAALGQLRADHAPRPHTD